MGQLVEVGTLSDVGPGETKIVSALGREFAIFNLEGELFAVDNSCPHMGGPIGEGIVQGDLVTCPWHDWSFDIKSGVCTINPAARLETFPVRVDQGRVYLDI